ncbi:MAG TPA: class I SAM-dependent methyltransferase [Thermoplasmata archaeon]|nr:class I SAM-dependent methyltransferase [Thermoplasmata archaeon]
MERIYEGFAGIYAAGPYPEFSRRIAGALPAVLGFLGHEVRTVLDLCCGEGTFAVEMARQGMEVTGVDRSPAMLELARRRADDAGVGVRFVETDVREIRFDGEFDLVSCWYDSLNYLPDIDDLGRAFDGVGRALRPGGLFMFDMNTIEGLAVRWQQHPSYEIQDTDRIFEVHRTSFDHETRTATLRITGFVRDPDGRWRRIDETHRERGYTITEISSALERAGLRVRALWGSLEEMRDLDTGDGRVWGVAGRAH